MLYTLDETDAAKIAAWRSNFRAFNTQFAGHKHPHEPGSAGATGHIAHTGRDALAGEVLPATVTGVKDPGTRNRVNIRVHLDGNDDYWATSVPEGSGPGSWQARPLGLHRRGLRLRQDARALLVSQMRWTVHRTSRHARPGGRPTGVIEGSGRAGGPRTLGTSWRTGRVTGRAGEITEGK